MKKPISRSKFKEDMKNFCALHKMNVTEFGLRALGDGSFIGRFEKGTSPTLDRIERVYDFMCNFQAKAPLDDICK